MRHCRLLLLSRSWHWHRLLTRSNREGELVRDLVARPRSCIHLGVWTHLLNVLLLHLRRTGLERVIHLLVPVAKVVRLTYASLTSVVGVLPSLLVVVVVAVVLILRVAPTIEVVLWPVVIGLTPITKLLLTGIVVHPAKIISLVAIVAEI